MIKLNNYFIICFLFFTTTSVVKSFQHNPFVRHDVFNSGNNNQVILRSSSKLFVTPTLITDLATQSLTAGSLAAAGDFFAQLSKTFSTSTSSEQQSSDYENDGIGRIVKQRMMMLEKDRTFRYMVKGLGSGILWACWYSNIDGFVDGYTENMLTEDLSFVLTKFGIGMDQAKNAMRIILSIILEQIVFCPIAYAFWDIPSLALMEGSSMEEVKERVNTKLGVLLINNAKVWTFANILIYSLPAQYRVLAMSMVDILWQAVLSSVLTSDNTNEKKSNEEELSIESAQR